MSSVKNKCLICRFFSSAAVLAGMSTSNVSIYLTVLRIAIHLITINGHAFSTNIN